MSKETVNLTKEELLQILNESNSRMIESTTVTVSEVLRGLGKEFKDHKKEDHENFKKVNDNVTYVSDKLGTQMEIVTKHMAEVEPILIEYRESKITAEKLSKWIKWLYRLLLAIGAAYLMHKQIWR